MSAEARPPPTSEYDRLLVRLGHELRTPVATLIMIAEGLADADPSAQIERQSQNLRRVTADLQAILDGVRELAHAWGGRRPGESRPFERQPVATRAWIEQLGRSLAQHAGESEARLTVDAAGDLPERLSTDAALIERVATLALGSAVASGAERVEVTIGRGGGGSLRLTLTDDGPLPSPEELAVLFEPFAAHGPRTRRSEGRSGLELATARALARALGGDVAGRTEDGRFGLEIRIPVD